MDCTDFNCRVEDIQLSIWELKELIKKQYDGVFSDGRKIIYEASIADAVNAYESLEQVKALCRILSNDCSD